MKEQYEELELKIVTFHTEDTILMSGFGDNDAEVPPEWGEGEFPD